MTTINRKFFIAQFREETNDPFDGLRRSCFNVEIRDGHLQLHATGTELLFYCLDTIK